MKEDKNKRNFLESSMEFGKVPPQCVDIEESVLGAIMLESDNLYGVMDILFGEMFYKESHQSIFAAIRRLFARSDSIDILTVTKELKSAGELELVGGPYYITELTKRVSSTANIETHVAYIEQAWRLRALIGITSEATKKAYEDTVDGFELLNDTTQKLLSISTSRFESRSESTKVLTLDMWENIKKIKRGEIKDDRIYTGFYKLDNKLNGFRPGELILVAARPGMGKTAFMMSLARNIGVIQKIPVAIFSLEMTKEQLILRLTTMDSEIFYKKIESANFDSDEEIVLDKSFNETSDASIYIDDTPGLGIIEARSKVLQLISKYKIKLAMFDYLQLMTASENKNGREREVALISAGLKNLAKSANIPVIALSQLNRDCESRRPPMPNLRDLRESGSLEMDSDVVMFLYRDEYYKYETFSGMGGKYEGLSTEGKARIIIAKHRNGETGQTVVGFKGMYMKFENEEEAPVEESGPVVESDIPF